MGYAHIENLYKNQEIFLFRECYALEKIHGTSAHVSWDGKEIRFFSGGANHAGFRSLFDAEALKKKFTEMGLGVGRSLTLYGEAYGGKEQGMSHTYGTMLKFIVFDVNIDDLWLSVDKADAFTKEVGLEFVHYVRIPAELKALDAERDAPSVQAVRNGITEPKKREGIVIRPVIELRKNNADRIISKHKGDEFKETKTAREVDPEKMKVLADAEAVADEWVTAMRLQHVLDKLPGHTIERMTDIIKAMVEDVEREAAGEIITSDAVRKAIGKHTAIAYKNYLKCALAEKVAP